jgi:hypothetical protein
MANVITFKFKSDAPWSEQELIDLADTFESEVTEIDDDHVPGSFKISVQDESDHADENAKVRESAIELIKKGRIVVGVALVDEDDEDIVSSREVEVPLS